MRRSGTTGREPTYQYALRRLSVRWVLVIIVISLAWPLTAGPAPSYFPLTPGATWTRKGDDGTQVSARVAGPKTVASVRCTVLETKTIRPDRQTTSRNCYQATDRELLLIEAEAEGRTVVLNPPRPVMQLPPAAGRTWTWNRKNAPSDAKVTDQWLSEEEVRVPAGTFRAWKLRSETKRGDTTFTLSTWYAPGVGIVKIERMQSTGTQQSGGISVLVSYKIP